jgi:hypothetical protein
VGETTVGSNPTATAKVLHVLLGLVTFANSVTPGHRSGNGAFGDSARRRGRGLKARRRRLRPPGMHARLRRTPLSMVPNGNDFTLMQKLYADGD